MSWFTKSSGTLRELDLCTGRAALAELPDLRFVVPDASEGSRWYFAAPCKADMLSSYSRWLSSNEFAFLFRVRGLPTGSAYVPNVR
jgi:hypothetical protein